MKRLCLEPEGWPCTLEECPPGLFLYNDRVCFKTEYRAMETIGPVNIPGDEIRWVVGREPDAYNCAGEHFCVREGEQILVQPLKYVWYEEES